MYELAFDNDDFGDILLDDFLDPAGRLQLSRWVSEDLLIFVALPSIDVLSMLLELPETGFPLI